MDTEAVKLTACKGAFYAALKIDYKFFKEEINSSQKFALQLYAEENVNVLTGELFFGKDFVRIIMCADKPVLKEFAERLKKFCKKWEK